MTSCEKKMIRDWIVVGIRDGRLAERLQLNPELTQLLKLAKVKRSRSNRARCVKGVLDSLQQ